MSQLDLGSGSGVSIDDDDDVGTTNRIVKFTGTDTIGDTAWSELNGVLSVDESNDAGTTNRIVMGADQGSYPVSLFQSRAVNSAAEFIDFSEIYTPAPGASLSNSYFGHRIQVTPTGTATIPGTLYADSAELKINTALTIAIAVGIRGSLENASGGTVTAGHGVYGQYSQSGAGTTTDGNAGTFWFTNTAGTTTRARSLQALEPLAFGGTVTNQVAFDLQGTLGILMSDVATAASITNMTVSSSWIRMTGSTGTTIHGIHADTFAKWITIYNSSSAIVTFADQSGTEGTAANRIITGGGANISIAPNRSAILHYDTTASRWVLSHAQIPIGLVSATDGIAIGKSASVGASAANAVAIGTSSSINSSGSGIAIGASTTIGSGATGCCVVGPSCTASSASCVAMGSSTTISTSSTSCIAIGVNASISTSASASLVIGTSATLGATASATTVVGCNSNCAGTSSSVTIFGQGSSCSSGLNGAVLIGTSCGVSSSSLNSIIKIGTSLGTSNSNSVTIGFSIATSASNQCVIGGTTQFTDFRFGKGATNTSAGTAITFQPSVASGTNIAGADVTWDGGQSTGNVAGGFFRIQTSPLGVSGSGANSFVERVTFKSATEVVFNDTGADYDLRVEGDTDANLLFVDASADAVGIGTSGPTAFLHLKAGTTAKATLTSPAATAPTSPVEGDDWNDSTQKSRIVYQAGVKQSLEGIVFTSTADTTVANTVTKTDIISTGIGTITLPANFFVIGKTVVIHVTGYFSTAVLAPTINVGCELGGTAVCATGAQTAVAALTNSHFHIEVVLTCRTTGSSGTVMAQGRFVYENVAAANLEGMVSTATTTINTTTSKAITIPWTWGTADASNTVTATNAYVEVKN